MPDAAPSPRTLPRRIVLIALLLGALSVLPYIGGVQHAFVYDDHGQIVENVFLQSDGRWASVLTLSTVNDAAIVNGRRPMVLLTYLIDHATSGLKPAGWRITNYLWHAVSVMLLFLLIHRVMRREAPRAGYTLFAFTASLLWAWHPAMVEAVHVPSFRPDLLVACFTLLAMHVGLVSSRAPLCALLGVAAATAGAVLSKESGLIVPLLIALLWACFPTTRPSRGWMAGTLCVAVAVIVLFALWSARPGPDGAAPPSLQAVGAEWNGRSLLFPDNMYTLPWLWGSYLRMLLWPWPLIVDRVVEPVPSIASLRFLWGAMTVLACAIFWLRARRPAAWLAFGAGITAIAFAPVSNLVPLLNPMAERYMPLMTAGFAVCAAWLLTGQGMRVGWGANARAAILAVLLAAYFSLGFLRVQDFRDDDALWTRTLQAEPRSARAHTWVGLLMQRQDRVADAIEYFGRARVLNPYDLTPRINSAILYGRLGELETAERLLREAVAIRPSFAPVHWNLAVVLQLQGRFDEALTALDDALRLDPYHVDARKARMVLWVHQERHADALRDAEFLSSIKPDDPEVRAAVAHLRGEVR